MQGLSERIFPESDFLAGPPQPSFDIASQPGIEASFCVARSGDVASADGNQPSISGSSEVNVTPGLNLSKPCLSTVLYREIMTLFLRVPTFIFLE